MYATFLDFWTPSPLYGLLIYTRSNATSLSTYTFPWSPSPFDVYILDGSPLPYMFLHCLVLVRHIFTIGWEYFARVAMSNVINANDKWAVLTLAVFLLCERHSV